jgi:hypothetical protein
MDETIIIDSSIMGDMPPEPPQLPASEVGQSRKHHRSEKKPSGFELRQPEREEPKEEKELAPVTPEQARAEALRPRLDRAPVRREGKTVRKAPKGQARPI